jgi:hypothetical protein
MSTSTSEHIQNQNSVSGGKPQVEPLRREALSASPKDSPLPGGLLRTIERRSAYIALAPISRAERVTSHKRRIFTHYDDKQQEFLDFVLAQYVKEGVGELAQAKLPDLLELKYHAVSDAVVELGSVANIRDVFIGFQEHLYAHHDD